MSGEQHRGGTKPGENPFFDEADAPRPQLRPRPQPRARRPKPPPVIITAGGVDMARGHASDIRVRVAAPDVRTDEPRVVVSIETDPRKVPTHKRLLDGRAAGDDTRSALLPGESTRGGRPRSEYPPSSSPQVSPSPPPPSAAPPPSSPQPQSAPQPQSVTAPALARPAPAPLPAWMRYALVVVLVLLVLGVVRRAGLWFTAPEAISMGEPPGLAVPPVTMRAVPVAPTIPAVAAASAPEESVDAPASRPVTPRAVTPALRPAKPASTGASGSAGTAAPKPAFTPLFELPGEKTKE